MTALQIVPGSVADMAARNNGQIVPPALCVLFDKSFSMQERDGQGEDGSTTSRFMAGVAQLTALQAAYPGQIVLIDFGDDAEVRPGGLPNEPNDGCTRLAPALQLAKELDTGMMRFVVISDGLPQDTYAALEVARTFRVGIDTIAVGTVNRGEAFLKELAETSCF